MDDIIIILAEGKTPSDTQIGNGLYEICDNVHSQCNDECPVYRLNGHEVPDTAKDYIVNYGCDCFKNGTAMLEFIRKHI